jgi:hypothetical protein
VRSTGPPRRPAPGLISLAKWLSASGEGFIAALGRYPPGALAIRHKHPGAWLVNAVMPVYPGHSNNAQGPLVVPRLPTGRFWGTLPLTAVVAAG